MFASTTTMLLVFHSKTRTHCCYYLFQNFLPINYRVIYFIYLWSTQPKFFPLVFMFKIQCLCNEELSSKSNFINFIKWVISKKTSVIKFFSLKHFETSFDNGHFINDVKIKVCHSQKFSVPKYLPPLKNVRPSKYYRPSLQTL